MFSFHLSTCKYWVSVTEDTGSWRIVQMCVIVNIIPYIIFEIVINKNSMLNLITFHSTFFELEILVIFTSTILLKLIIGTWHYLLGSSNVLFNPSRPVYSESCIDAKIKFNFYFHTSLWCLKRFYEGLEALIKPFEVPQRSVKIKI